jgi:hypothetical protein
VSGRIDFNNKAEEILNFVDTYEVLNPYHIEKFFPDSSKIIDYLVKNKRLFKSHDNMYISADQILYPDKALITSISVLGDLLEKVKTHSRAIAPAQISFLTHNGNYYEIIYVGYGMEAMVTAFLETQLAAKARLKDYVDVTKRMVIVEDKHQMERLQIQGIERFILVQPDGSLSYFKGS